LIKLHEYSKYIITSTKLSLVAQTRMPAVTIDVSVVICAHNEEKLLKRSVDSALSQQGLSLELMLVNDNSTDGTLGLMQRLAHKDARIKVIDNQENLGPAESRNRAARSAIGEWICPLDADDWFGEGRLARLVEAGRRYNVDMVSDDIYFVPQDHEYNTQRLLSKRYRDICTLVTVEDFIEMSMPLGLSWGYMKPLVLLSFLKRNSISYNEGLRIMEDWDYYMRCMLQGARFLLVGEPRYYYLVAQNSLSKVGTDQSRMLPGIQNTQAIMDMARAKNNLTALNLLKIRERFLHRIVSYYDFSAALKSLNFFAAIKEFKKDPGALPFHTTLGLRSLTARIAGLMGIRSLEL
jgi:succinoglycan biosynthesis protein ExoO